MSKSKSLYHYKALITSVVDGDTATADIDLGWSVIVKSQRLRLIGINAPEMKLPDNTSAIAARDYLSSLILNKEVLIATHKDRKEKYGRFLAEIWLQEGDEKSVNQMMLDSKNAVIMKM